MKTNKTHRSIFYKSIISALGKMFDDVTDEAVSMTFEGRPRLLTSDGLYVKPSENASYVTDGMVAPAQDNSTGNYAVYVKRSSYVILINEVNEQLLLNIVVAPEKLTLKKFFEIRKKYRQIFNSYMVTI